MSSGKLLISFFGLMAYRGMILGPIVALVGWLVVFLIFISIYIVYALIYGVIVGVLIGGICGLICGVVTLLFFREMHDERAYIRVMMTTSSATAFPLGVLIVGATNSFYAVSEVPLLNELSLLGGVLAACGAAYAGREMGNWYIQSVKSITGS
jgi:hypothetical protein